MHVYNNSRPKSFDDWAKEIKDLAGMRFMRYPPSEAFLLLVESGGIIAENIRRDRYQEVLSDLGLCLCSLINVYNRVADDSKLREVLASKNFPPLDIFIFNRFPRRCPHCGNKHCVCAINFFDSENRTMEEKQAMEDEVEKMLDISRANEKPPDSLDDFKELFRGIYGQGHQYMTTETICFHLFEEVGELARALRNLFRCQSSHLYGAYCEFMNEFADIISWIFALWRKVEYHIKNTFVKGHHTELLEPSKLLNIVLQDHKQWFQDDSNKKSVA